MQSVQEKLARMLVAWRDRAGRISEEGLSIEVPLTHTEIAQLLGTSRETVTRALNDMKECGLLAGRGHKLFIRDAELLNRLAGVQG
jgi:CRP/FNR family transcriptional regulator